MDNFGIYKLISSLKSCSSNRFDGNSILNNDGLNAIEQLIKTVLPILSSTVNNGYSQKKEQPKTQNKTSATAEILRRHDDFVQKVYKSHGKNFKQ